LDFRRDTGDRHLQRRPRSEWWSDVIASVGHERVTAPRPGKKLENFGGWIRKCVAPSLAACAALTGQTLATVLEDFTSGSHYYKDPNTNAVAVLYAQQFDHHEQRRRA